MEPLQDTSLEFLETLFEHLADVVFCVKSREGIYLAVNTAFVVRAGANSRQEMIGQKSHHFFSPEMVAVFDAQDAEVFRDGNPVVNQLEQITNADGTVGWYLASKFPLRDAAGQIIGLVGISQDLHTPTNSELELADLTHAVEFIENHLDRPLKVEQIADQLDLSVEQLDRRMKKVYRLSTKKFIMKTRLERAARLLTESEHSLAEIASQCGFTDQSAFTRQFKATFLTTPAQYRKR